MSTLLSGFDFYLFVDACMTLLAWSSRDWQTKGTRWMYLNCPRVRFSGTSPANFKFKLYWFFFGQLHISMNKEYEILASYLRTQICDQICGQTINLVFYKLCYTAAYLKRHLFAFSAVDYQILAETCRALCTNLIYHPESLKVTFTFKACCSKFNRM